MQEFIVSEDLTITLEYNKYFFIDFMGSEDNINFQILADDLLSLGNMFKADEFYNIDNWKYVFYFDTTSTPVKVLVSLFYLGNWTILEIPKNKVSSLGEFIVNFVNENIEE